MSAVRQDSRFHKAAAQVVVFTENRWVVFTQKFILIIVGFIIAVDLYLALNDVRGDTISEVMKEWAYRRFFVLTWTWGVLAGHLFLTRTDAVLPAPWNIWLLLGITLATLLVGLGPRGPLAVQVQGLLLIAGAAAGYLLWPQSPVA